MTKKAEVDFVVEKVPSADIETVERTIELGDEARDRLGLLPRAAYFDAASKDCLLAARHLVTGKIAGYVLFRLPRDEVVLTHVCVDPRYHRSGIAALLVDEVGRRHKRRQGIRAKCRDDYPNIARVWSALGFAPRARAIGRGRDAAPMTVWWRDHGHPNLFTPPLDEPAVVAAAIDTNVLIDLHLQPDSRRADRSRVLQAPDLVGRIELVVPFGLERDLTGEADGHRDRLLNAADQYRRPRSRPGRSQELFDVIAGAITPHVPGYPITKQDFGDLWQLAEAAASGIKVFLTWDERLRTEIAPHLLHVKDCPAVSQLRVLDPDRLIIHLDELAHAVAYQPVALEGSDFRAGKASATDKTDLMRFLDERRGEKRSELRACLGKLAREQQDHLIVRDPEGEPVACYALVCEGEVLRVPLLRLADHAIAGTLGRQLLWRLRKEALERGARVVEVDDPYLSPLVDRIAGFESYQQVERKWYAFVVASLGPGTQVTAAATHTYKLVGLPAAPLIAPGLDPSAAAYYERAWWPAKITDSGLPCFAVAIKPTWSAGLFGRPETLLSRRADVALGREQVYYRSGRNSAVKQPGRILWYMSGSSVTGPGRFIGTSLVDHIETGRPDQLFSTYGHYGVFGLADLQEVARGGQAQALRLSDTELFPVDIPWAAYLRLREEIGGPKTVQSPVKISPELFAAIYARGNRHRPTSASEHTGGGATPAGSYGFVGLRD
ncbi:GNAT family N-acetyltransferase [Amycolatopsis sp. cmx-4-83]|uniref:GNAT family N-acetyltransferase n=1 Tax=Amycolatopsis sp. cmx-4-83 TaxID=2790940 RepID=UPI00397DA64B